jgi:hypothetical protein
MGKEWKVTHRGENNEELFLCDGKYYSQHAWQHFGDAYRGQVTEVAHGYRLQKPIRFTEAGQSPVFTGVDFAADPDGNTRDLSDVHWGMDDEDTEELHPLPDAGTNKFMAGAKASQMTPEQIAKIRKKIDEDLAKQEAKFNAWYFGPRKP